MLRAAARPVPRTPGRPARPRMPGTPIGHVSCATWLSSPCSVESFVVKHAHGFEQPVPVSVSVEHHQRFEPNSARLTYTASDVASSPVASSAHTSSAAASVEAPDEDRKPPHEQLVDGVEELVAPVHRACKASGGAGRRAWRRARASVAPKLCCTARRALVDRRRAAASSRRGAPRRGLGTAPRAPPAVSRVQAPARCQRRGRGGGGAGSRPLARAGPVRRLAPFG